MVATVGHTLYMRQWRHKRRVLTLLKKVGDKPPGHRAKPKRKPRPSIAAPFCDFRCDRLRQFQQWYRFKAGPEERRFDESSDFIRSTRLPLTCIPSVLPCRPELALCTLYCVPHGLAAGHAA